MAKPLLSNLIATLAFLCLIGSGTALGDGVTLRKQAGQKPSKNEMGKLGQAIEKVAIHSQPELDSKVVYNLSSHEYLVIQPYGSRWYKILLQNGQFGYGLRSKIDLLPYAVSGTRPTPAPNSKKPGQVALYALSFVGQPVTKKWEGGGFIHEAFGPSIPSSLKKQSEMGTAVTRLEDLKAGDRVYFWDDRKERLGFGGIYVGNGYFVGPLPDHKTVATDYLGSKKWLKLLECARR